MLSEIMSEMAKAKRIFHSEKDFQLALAWSIHERTHGLYRVRMEKRVFDGRTRQYIDIWCFSEQHGVLAIELKYATTLFRTTVDGEEFELLNQSAQDEKKYSFLRDVARLETLVSDYASHGQKAKAAAIFLTNDKHYWKPISRSSKDEDFRLTHGRTLRGDLSWRGEAGWRQKAKCADIICLKSAYELNWQPYCTLTDFHTDSPVDFQYILLEVRVGNHSANKR